MSAIPKPKATRLTPPLPMRPVHRFSVEQYHRMIEIGILNEHDRVELLDGLIVPKITHNPPHDACVSLVQAAFLRRVPSGWIVRIQSAITIPGSEPEPDVAVVRGPERRYARSHPRPRDITLLVEVADSTIEEDREGKGPLYAKARIPVYWLVNLKTSTVEVYTQPRRGKALGYRQREDHGADDVVPLVIDGRQVAKIRVRDLLP